MERKQGADRATFNVSRRLKHAADLIAKAENRPLTTVLERALRAYVESQPGLREQEPSLRHALGL
jgi:predicted transcriptional regulator